MFDELLLNPFTKVALKHYLNRDSKVVQSLVLYGEKGLGKRTVAEEISKFLLNYGGNHPLDTHPDFYRVEPEKGIISKLQSDKIRSFVNICTSIAPRRVVLIDDAETMGVSGANSLLKTLEDDERSCVIIFVAHKKLIPTIMSRCEVIEFMPVEDILFDDFLTGNVNKMIMAACGGRIGRYRQLVEDSVFIKEVEVMVNTFNQMDHPRELLVACHAIKEKDKKYIYEVFDAEQRDSLFIFLQSIFQHHLMALFNCGDELAFVNGDNLRRFYGVKQSMDILSDLESSKEMLKRKGMYSKNDFFELLLKFSKKGEMENVKSKNETLPV